MAQFSRYFARVGTADTGCQFFESIVVLWYRMTLVLVTRRMAISSLAIGIASCSTSMVLASPHQKIGKGVPMNPPDDFDFLIGHWHVSHRRLINRLVGSDDWQEFQGECHAWKIMGGYGNVDDNVLNIPSASYRAITVRSFDPVLERWAIWWLDGRTPHTLDVPVKGNFSGDVGTFLANDVFDGKPIIVRFQWFKNPSGMPRWEQAFSADGGKSWELNWIMDFKRNAA